MDNQTQERVKTFIWGILAIAGIQSAPYFGQISFGWAWVGDVVGVASFFILGWLLSSHRG